MYINVSRWIITCAATLGKIDASITLVVGISVVIVFCIVAIFLYTMTPTRTAEINAIVTSSVCTTSTECNNGKCHNVTNCNVGINIL